MLFQRELLHSIYFFIQQSTQGSRRVIFFRLYSTFVNVDEIDRSHCQPNTRSAYEFTTST